MVARVASTSLVTNSPAVWRVQRSSSSCGVITASPFLEMLRKRLVRIAPIQGLRVAIGPPRPAASGAQEIRLPVFDHPFDGLPIGQVLGQDAARQLIEASQGCKTILPLYARTLALDFARHLVGQFLGVLVGSLNASGENRLRITYVAMRHLLSALLITLFVKTHSNGSTVTRIRFGNGFGSSYLSTYTVPTTGRRPSVSSA